MSFVATHLPAQPEDVDGVISRNVEKPSHFYSAVRLRNFHLIRLPRKFREILLISSSSNACMERWTYHSLVNYEEWIWTSRDEAILHRQSGRRRSAKLVPTFADRGVSRGQRNGSPRPFNLCFLDRSRYWVELSWVEGWSYWNVVLWKTGTKLDYYISRNNTKECWVSELHEILWILCLKRGFGTCVLQGSRYTARVR